MGFFESFIIVSIFGFSANLLGKKYRRTHKTFPFWWAFFSVFGMLAIDFSIYIGLLDSIVIFMNQQISWFSITSGKDFMWNSFSLFGAGKYISPAPGMDLIAAVLFLSYPAWFIFNKSISAFLFGVKSNEEGMTYLLRKIVEKPSENENR
ncbi:MAG: hypothetical protein ACTSVI_05500 [Promethearchaeota archaeon]